MRTILMAKAKLGRKLNLIEMLLIRACFAIKEAFL